MGKEEVKKKKKPIGKMVLAGIFSVALYTTLILKQDMVTEYFSRGGVLYALLPIAAAFIFSFAHGSFTGNFWTVLGVEAKRKKEVK